VVEQVIARCSGIVPGRLGGWLLAAGLALSAAIVSPAAGAARPEAGESLRVYLMTMGPGDAVWERFGHNAIWIHDPGRGFDPAYNYGIFSFDQPGFVGRLMMGRMLYSMAPDDAQQLVAAYAWADRDVRVQELNLTAAQKLRLREFLEWNALPANRDYFYDYFRDNCSTRVRDAIDLALDGALRAALDTVPTGTTYRSHSLRLTHDDVPVYTGLALALGPATDQPLTAWEEGFIPMSLSAHIADVRVVDERGARVPLVLEERLLHQSGRVPPPDRAPRRWPYFMAVGLMLAAAIIGAKLLAARRPRLGPALFAGVAAAWSGVVGFFGTLIVLLWALTEHSATYRNENVLQASPLSLVFAILLPIAALDHLERRPRIRRVAAWLGLLIAALSLLGLLLKPLPWLDQSNAEILALLIPPHLALAWAVYPWRRPQVSALEDSSH
jgi:hypothetical protein